MMREGMLVMGSTLFFLGIVFMVIAVYIVFTQTKVDPTGVGVLGFFVTVIGFAIVANEYDQRSGGKIIKVN